MASVFTRYMSSKAVRSSITKTLRPILLVKTKDILNYFKRPELLQEIPLFKIDDQENLMLVMNEITIGAVFPKINSQLLYVYDFLKMWRFSITYIKESENEIKENSCIKSIGEIPKEAPEIQFETKKEFDQFDDTFEDFDESNEYEY